MNLLIDGSGLLWRSYYRNKKSDFVGEFVNIFLLIKTIKSYVNIYNSRNVYIAWDERKSKEPNFRNVESNGTYKAQRDKTANEEVYKLIPKIHEITESLGCKNFYPWKMEADDILSWLSKTLDGQNIIITSDTDMLQLINNRTCVYDPRKKETIDHNNFTATQGMPLEHYIAYKAIKGDVADNIKGIDGYGLVRSKTLAKQWCEDPKSIDADIVPIIEKNIKLMDLNIGYTIAGEKELEYYKEQLNDVKDITAKFDKFELLCKKYDFNSILDDIDKWKRMFDIPQLLKILRF